MGYIRLTLAAALVVIMNTFAFDDGAKWDIYVFSLPVRKKQIVFEKYIFMLIMAAAVSLLSGIFCAVSRQTANMAPFLTLAACAGGTVIICSIMIPFIYKFGIQKAWLIFILIVFLVPMMLAPAIRSGHLSTLSESEINRMVSFVPVIIAAFFIVSYFISCVIVKNKDV